MSCSLAIVNARLNNPAEARRWFQRGTELLGQQLYVDPALRDLHAEAAETLAKMGQRGQVGSY
jgi:hypothetical protein